MAVEFALGEIYRPRRGRPPRPESAAQREGEQPRPEQRREQDAEGREAQARVPGPQGRAALGPVDQGDGAVVRDDVEDRGDVERFEEEAPHAGARHGPAGRPRGA
jgi:hypothetical protein